MRRLLPFLFASFLLIQACGLLSAPGAPVSPPTAPLPAMVLHEPRGRFSIEVPTGWDRLGNGEDPIVFSGQVAPGTSLLEKRMELDVRETTAACRQSTYEGAAAGAVPEHVQINGTDFLKETGAGVAAGNLYEWTSYTTSKGWTCITVTFVLHSASSGVYSTEPPAFDRLAESAVFDQLINSFQFDP